MTPQLQQAIKLLQLSNIELNEYVESELEQNPLLERDDTAGSVDSDGLGGPDGSGGDGAANSTGEDFGDAVDPDLNGLKAVDFSDQGNGTEAIAGDMGNDMDTGSDWNNDSISNADIAAEQLSDQAFSDWGSGGQGTDFGGALPNLEETVSGNISLRDHLGSQMALSMFDPVDRLIGASLIDMLDGSGYISGELDQLADGLGCSLQQVEAVLEVLQSLDPPGIFARDLSECLGLQLKELDRLDPAMQALLGNLEMLAKRDLAGLMDICGVDEEDITDMVAEIRELDPKPAEAFDGIVAQPVVPDVIMRSVAGGNWVVELNTDTLPKVLVNNTYFTRISRDAGSKADKQYINDCYQSANWLVKSLHQRATTILKVASELVRQQDAFFIRGVQYLKPLVLRDIAEAIEMHESTVSRVTSNKFMATPRGIFELKYFFTAAIGSSSGGESHSAESVRHRIKALIKAEPMSKILSDDKIVTLLRGEGVDIARRTVAKYRESLSIPSSVQRRREKNSAL